MTAPCQLVADEDGADLFTDLDDTDPLLDDDGVDCDPIPPIDYGGRGGRVRLMEPDDWLIALPARYPWE